MRISQLNQQLYRVLEVNKILQRHSLSDWRDGVSMVLSQTTGQNVGVRFETDENQNYVGINYLVPLSSEEIKEKINEEINDEKPLDQAIVFLAQKQGFNSDDNQWGLSLAQKIQLGDSLTIHEVKEACKRLTKYQKIFQSNDLKLPIFEEIAYQYDSSFEPMKLITGDQVASPFGNVTELEAALNQKSQPSEISNLLLKNGEIFLSIGQSLQNRNSDLDGLDVLSMTANLIGATSLILAAATEQFRQKAALSLDPDGILEDSRHDLGEISQNFDLIKEEAQLILQARGESLSFKPIAFTGDNRRDLAIFSQSLQEQQSILLQALDDSRMPLPIEVDGSNESILQAIAKLKGNNQELKQLVQTIFWREQPLKTIDGAIFAEALFEQARQFFQAREEVNQRLFNGALEYQLKTQQGLIVTWNAQNFTVVDPEGNSLCHIHRDIHRDIHREGDIYQVVGDAPTPELVTVLTHFPTSSEQIRRLAAETSLLKELNQISPFYSDKQLNIRASHQQVVQDLCTFSFNPQASEIIGIEPDKGRVWHSIGEQIIIDQFPLNILEKISRQLSRPMMSQQSQESQKSQKSQQPALTVIS